MLERGKRFGGVMHEIGTGRRRREIYCKTKGRFGQWTVRLPQVDRQTVRHRDNTWRWCSKRKARDPQKRKKKNNDHARNWKAIRWCNARNQNRGTKLAGGHRFGGVNSEIGPGIQTKRDRDKQGPIENNDHNCKWRPVWRCKA